MEYFEQLFANKLDNKWNGKFLGRQKLPKSCQEEICNLLTSKSPEPTIFTEIFYQILKRR